MDKDNTAKSENCEKEEDEMAIHTDDDVTGPEDEDEDEDEEADVTGGQKEDEEEQRGRELMEDKRVSRAGDASKANEVEIASTEREVPRESPRRKVVKEEPREIEEKKTPKDEIIPGTAPNARGCKWKPHTPLLLLKETKRKSSDVQEIQNCEIEEEDEDETEPPDDNGEDDKSEERMEFARDLALSMSSSWVPLSEREIESLNVIKSGKDETDREFGSYSEVQSESFKERGRAREDDGDLAKEKSRLKKQKISELPILSLSLPDTSLQLASSDPGHAVKSKTKSSGPAPKTSENERSYRSLGPTQSLSNGFTNSLSLSLSQGFFHNASCSLTQNSFDDKDGTTCSSRQHSVLRDDADEGTRGSSFGGREQFHDRSKHRRELPLYQRLLQSGNQQQLLRGSLANGEGTRDSCRSFMDERPVESLGIHARGNEGSHGDYSQGCDQYRWKDDASFGRGLERGRTSHDRHWSTYKESLERNRKEGWPSPTRSSSFQDRKLEPLKMSDRERRPDACAGRELNLSGSRGFLDRGEDSAGDEKGIVVEEDLTIVKSSKKVEKTWLQEIVTEPIPLMAQKLQQVPNSFLETLKKCLQETLGSTKRKDEFVSLQRILQRRSDLAADSLHQSHRTQLEILVALKTGIPAFLHPDIPLTTPALIEIFLGMKCRNVACQSQLPADDCECKVCSSKGGFCNACMCVVCCKFDFDANTCRWIGCDFCLHWCHSDCGIQSGHISSGISTRGTSCDSVMQFRCIGCGHTSELYGFVKDVFTTCAKEWSLEILARELHCVRRIFHKSDDLRGKQLFGKAEQLLVKLDTSRDVEAVCQSMMKFFTAEKELPVPQTNSAADGITDAIPLPGDREMTSRLADAVRDAIHVIKAPNVDGTDLEKARASLQFFEHQVEEKRQEASELHQERTWQKSQIEELENIVQIKQAEAKMFQMRADEVRREAEGLQRIVQAKSEKIEEEYKLKTAKLRLQEAEERRRKWLEDVQNMEKAHQEYSALKMSMVSDIRELLKKMESARPQL